MKILYFSFQNLKGKPNEDYYLISQKYLIFTVADGVSRIKNPNGSYPKISGARLAAEVFCQTSVDYLEKHYQNLNLKILKKAFNVANKEIFKVNEKYRINKKLDYSMNDYFSTCGVAATVKGNILYYGYVGDCGLRIYNQNDFLKFVSIDDVALLEEWRNNQQVRSEKEFWLIWRKILRNKPSAPYLTYGVFTGEKEVEYYYHLGKINLQKGDLVFLYSDGFLHFIKKLEFRKLFRIYKKNELFKKINPFINREIRSRQIIKATEEIFLDDKTLIVILI